MPLLQNEHFHKMTASVDDAINVYKQLATFPSVKYGRISMEDTPGHLHIYSEWTQRDLERSETLKFARSHVVQLDVVVPTLPHVICDELWNKESPSGRSVVDFPSFSFNFFDTFRCCGIPIIYLLVRDK